MFPKKQLPCRACEHSEYVQLLTLSRLREQVGEDSVIDLDPSTLKRFWSPCDGGEMFRIYRDEKAKWVDITVEHYSTIVNTVANGAKAISIS